ncbi:LamG-like jellyroll fold domain-containing protein [Nocardioides sp. WS12]|uniref:LamG-like jellyroll fold domain-containing protein n=1 Tax=Nocardioides sp. WS12 TaxID=2486272 RepID=UPI0015FE21BF|nr:LamG-like jellyroll fold domain-containing protein [Nocardioides sp. WS12]
MTGRPRFGPLLLALVVALAILVLGAEVTRAGWTTAQVATTTNSVKVGRLAFTHTYASTTCVGTGPADTACTGGPVTNAASSSSAQTLDTTLSNQTTGGGSFTQQVQVTSCAPAAFTNATTGGDPLLPRNRVTRNVADTWGTTSAAAFDGSTQYAADVTSTTTAAAASTSYSIGLWFKAAPGSAGGGLLSLNASPVDTTSAGANPSVYLDPSGRVRARFDGVPILIIPVILTVASGAGTDYRDGQWHHIALTVGRSILTTDLRLYVDGALADSALGVTLLVGTGSAAWWHVGWTDTTGLVGLGNPTPYFTGSLSGVFRTTTALSAGTVSSLAGASSASAYASALSGGQHVWMLAEGRTATYTPAIPYVTGGNPCTHVRLGWTLGATSAFTPTAITSLTSSGWLPASPAAAPAGGAGHTLTTSYSRVPVGYDSDVAGLELVTALGHRASLSGTSWRLLFEWTTAVLLG